MSKQFEIERLEQELQTLEREYENAVKKAMMTFIHNPEINKLREAVTEVKSKLEELKHD